METKNSWKTWKREYKGLTIKAKYIRDNEWIAVVECEDEREYSFGYTNRYTAMAAAERIVNDKFNDLF